MNNVTGAVKTKDSDGVGFFLVSSHEVLAIFFSLELSTLTTHTVSRA